MNDLVRKELDDLQTAIQNVNGMSPLDADMNDFRAWREVDIRCGRVGRLVMAMQLRDDVVMRARLSCPQNKACARNVAELAAFCRPRGVVFE